MLTSLTTQLQGRQSLTREQVKDAIASLVSESVAPEEKADFLGALAAKGETVQEIAAFADELRQRAIQPEIDSFTRAGEILDVCGTGGDRLNTFNISTCVALVAAAAGVGVAKHGNRAITSQSGSADVLEELGIRTDLSPEEAAASLREHHFAFFFAPKFHPAFKHIAPARKICAERGLRTIFNFLGPLLNPARPTAQLIGVPRPELCETIGRVLQNLGARRGMVVCGSIGTELENNTVAYLDEMSAFGTNRVAEFHQDRGFNVSEFRPDQFPRRPGSLADLIGGGRRENAEIVRRIFRGEERGPKRDVVVLNSAAALFVSGKVPTVMQGWDLAGELIDSGRAMAKLDELAAASR